MKYFTLIADRDNKTVKIELRWICSTLWKTSFLIFDNNTAINVWRKLCIYINKFVCLSFAIIVIILWHCYENFKSVYQIIDYDYGLNIICHITRLINARLASNDSTLQTLRVIKTESKEHNFYYKSYKKNREPWITPRIKQTRLIKIKLVITIIIPMLNGVTILNTRLNKLDQRCL